jgi:hypothetical protein
MMNKGKELAAKKRTKCMLNKKSKRTSLYYLGEKMCERNARGPQ